MAAPRVFVDCYDVRRTPWSYCSLEGFVPCAARWQLDRNGSHPTPSHAGPRVLAALATRLRGAQRMDRAAYRRFTSCQSSAASLHVIPLLGDVRHDSPGPPVNRDMRRGRD